MSSHVPAWKRLGLKLKYSANDQTSDIITSPERKRRADNSTSPPKKRRVSTDSLLTHTESSDISIPKIGKTTFKNSQTSNKSLSRNATTASDGGDSTNLTPIPTRRKSVAFTPETKIEDGDSTKQLFDEWAADQKAKDPSFSSGSNPALSTPKPSQIEENVDFRLSEPERRVERLKSKQKKIAARSKGAVRPENSKIDPALTYLDQYCNAKTTWKFNKIHQITLLKNVFSLHLIPSNRIEQLYSYIRGLKGHARTVLRDSAMTVKVEDLKQGKENFSKLDHVAKVEQAYEADLKEYVAAMTAATAHPAIGYEEAVILRLSDDAIRSRMAKRMRSERILVEMAQDAESESVGRSKMLEIEEDIPAEKRVRLDNDKLVRKRKQRTVVIEDDDSTSSSGDSEDENSDESGDDDHIDQLDRTKTRQAGDDTLSSSETSAGSEEGSSHSENDAGNSEGDTSSEDE